MKFARRRDAAAPRDFINFSLSNWNEVIASSACVRSRPPRSLSVYQSLLMCNIIIFQHAGKLITSGSRLATSLIRTCASLRREESNFSDLRARIYLNEALIPLALMRRQTLLSSRCRIHQLCVLTRISLHAEVHFELN